MFEDYTTKESVIIVYTGEGKGKTSASLGLLVRALGTGWRVAYIQFVKSWEVGEHKFIADVKPLYEDKLFFYKGGEGFYNAGDLSAKKISENRHKEAAATTYALAMSCATNGEYDLVICDEINNAVNDGLLSPSKLNDLLTKKAKKTSLCLTGRDFPPHLLNKVDIATEMKKTKHHYDNKFLANKGIDF